MCALNLDSVPIQLEQYAARLRPDRRNFVPVLRIASKLGVNVRLCLEKGTRRPSARAELLSTPFTIHITRPSAVTGFRDLVDGEDHLLTARERFSVAHELGHCVAYEEFGLLPSTNRSEYWIQEEWMHRFAAALLTPEWFVHDCLNHVPRGEPVSPFLLRSWAKNTARVSQEVLAKRLCMLREGLGFLKLAPVRRTNGRLALQVQYSCAGAGLKIPANHSLISNVALLNMLERCITGRTTMKSGALGRVQTQDIEAVWLRSGILPKQGHTERSREPELVPLFWVSVTAKNCLSDPQLRLW